jgi:hypothetical protein
VEIPLRVSFDSNTYRQVINPPVGARDASPTDLQRINDALRSGRIRGYLSDTIVRLEGIGNKDRVPVLGSTRLVSQTQATGQNTITISLSMQQNRKPVHSTTLKWIQAAQKLGMRFMRTGSRWFSGAGHISDDDDAFYEPEETITALINRMKKVDQIAEEIQAHGLGYAAAVCLGLKFSERAGAVGEWWLQALQRACNQTEEAEVQKAVREWADGDSVSAHVGYDNDLFCSKDKAKGAGGKPSVLDKHNRAWLTSTYRVQFITLTELAGML